MENKSRSVRRGKKTPTLALVIALLVLAIILVGPFTGLPVWITCSVSAGAGILGYACVGSLTGDW